MMFLKRLPISVCVTSYARPELLEKTLDSLIQGGARLKVRDWLIADNSGDPRIRQLVEGKYKGLFSKAMLDEHPPSHNAQHRNVDWLYTNAANNCVFHVEDDRTWYRSKVIRAINQMWDVIHADPILSVVHSHPKQEGFPFSGDEVRTPKGTEYYLKYYRWKEAWGGYSWISGMRLLDRLEPFRPFGQYDKEAEISVAALDLGLRVGNLKLASCYDMGGGKTTFK